jgi:hypothetical protein
LNSKFIELFRQGAARADNISLIMQAKQFSLLFWLLKPQIEILHKKISFQIKVVLYYLP